VWIVPKTLQASLPFALDTVASSEDLNSLASTIESSLMWRSKPSPLRTWLQRWKREPWLQRLFGRILKPSQHTCFEIEWISSLAATHVSHLATQANDAEQKTLDTFGPTSKTMCGQLDLFSVSLKTSKDTSIEDSKKLSETWKNLVTKRRGEYLVRQKLAHRIKENESSSWPTPTVDSSTVRNKKYNQGGMPLQMAAKLWPTPTASDSEGGPRQQDGKRGRALKDLPNAPWMTPLVQDSRHSGTNPSKNGARMLLANQVHWPTPTSRDWKDTPGMATQAGSRSRLDQLPRAVFANNGDQKSGQLNPTWVEWLMGLPLGWTDLGFWATE